ncbi:MAG TPA: glycosyltransferase family 39 protein [Pyrinomonadaceae bacterium]|nr:glycosyltransferase family 39 protein [Pyrinomonadaceae bacterium]
MTTTDAPGRRRELQLGAFNTQTLKRPAALLTALLVLLYAAARLWRLTAACLWFDEIFGVHAARHSWAGLWRFVAADLIHPPLFYALLKVWTAAGGESLLWLRLFPAVASIVAVVPFLLLARELRLGAWATNAALAIAAANGYLVKYAQEVRMYGLLLLLTLTSLWLFARLLDADRRRRGLYFALLVVNLLLVYTHYYGWLVVACEAALLVFRQDWRRLRAFLISAAALALAYAPWVLACARAASPGAGLTQPGGLAQNIGWITRPGVRDLIELFTLFNQPFYFRQSSTDPLYARGGALVGLLLVGLPVAVLLFGAARRLRAGANASGEVNTEGGAEVNEGGAGVNEGGAGVSEGGGAKADEGGDAKANGVEDASVAFLLNFTLLPVGLAFVASYLLPQSVWGTRHLIVAAGPYALLAGLALGRLRPFWWKAGALMLVCCWFALVGLLTLARRPPAYVWCAWENLATSAASEESRAGGANAAHADAASAARPTDLYAFEDLVAYHLWFALERGGAAGRFRVVKVKDAPGVVEDAAYFLPRDFDGVARARPEEIQGERFWAAFRDTAWDESRQPLKLITERGYRAERVYESAAQGQRAFLVLFVRAGQNR